MNAIGRWRGTGGGKSLLFNGHLDTNPVTEGWTVDPWGGVYDDRFVYGIGVSNMKAGDAASFYAVERLIERGGRPRGGVVLTYVGGASAPSKPSTLGSGPTTSSTASPPIWRASHCTPGPSTG